jgi:hypothetical protein
MQPNLQSMTLPDAAYTGHPIHATIQYVSYVVVASYSTGCPILSDASTTCQLSGVLPKGG